MGSACTQPRCCRSRRDQGWSALCVLHGDESLGSGQPWPSCSGGFPDLGRQQTLIGPLPVKPFESKGCVLCGGGDAGMAAPSGLQPSIPPAQEPH